VHFRQECAWVSFAKQVANRCTYLIEWGVNSLVALACGKCLLLHYFFSRSEVFLKTKVGFVAFVIKIAVQAGSVQRSTVGL